jgi:hypothetical protein
MAEPVRHRQTKGAATDMFDLQPPRHISTLRLSPVAPRLHESLFTEPTAGAQPWRQGTRPHAPIRPLPDRSEPAQSGESCHSGFLGENFDPLGC